MKLSNYNIFMDASGTYSFVYNAVTRAVLTVDEELRECLERNTLEKIDPSLVDPLKKCGIIIEDSVNELKMYRLKHNIAKYDAERSSFLIFTTYACNLRCPYCYEGPVVSPEFQKASMGPDMTSQVIQFICNQTLQNRSQTLGIGLYGGEPLLNLDCCESVVKNVSQWCAHYGIRFYTTVTTNGTLLTESAYKRIGKYLSSVHVTLDGPQKFHDRKRIKKDGSGSYSEILDNLKLLKDTKEHLSIRINFDEENRSHMKEVLDDLEEIGLRGRPYFHVYFAQIIPQNACLSFPSDPGYRKWRRESIAYYLPLMRMAIERGWRNHMALEIGQEHSLVPANVISCDYVKRGVYSIDPFGDIYICPASGGDRRYRVGELCNGTVEWNSSYYNILTRDPSLIGPCRKCEMLPMCGGGCAIASYFKYEDYNTTFCNFNKEQIYERLKTYLRFKYPEKFDVEGGFALHPRLQ